MIRIGDLIRSLEEQLLDPAVRRIPEAVAALLADEFVEFGSSGRRYDRPGILAALAEEQGFSAQLYDFTVHNLAPDCVLATYGVRIQRAGEEPQDSLRSSLWRHRDGRWQMWFHQGTPAGAQAKK